jgi:hypothetical protein
MDSWESFRPIALELRAICERAEMNDKANIDKARAHLAAALAQTIDKDDPIIMGHVRSAYLLLGGRL